MIGQLVLALSLLVGLHEFGHFFFAKLFKIRVSKFYIFFDFLFPLPNVLNFSLFKKKVGETEYGIGWFPLGGYVAIHGMVDETQDADALAGPPQPDEFRAKPAWQRLLVMLGGIIMNVITGIVVFSLMTYVLGESYLPAAGARYGVVPSKLGREIGFQTGDNIVKINGRPFTEFEDVYDPDVLLGSHSYFTVERKGQLTDINLPANFIDRGDPKTDARFVRPREPFAVGRVVGNSPADKAGLKAGDRITAVNGQPVPLFDEFQAALLAQANKRAQLTVQRGTQTLTLPVQIDELGHIGFEYKTLLPLAHRSFSLGQSLAPGTRNAFTVVTSQAKALGKMARGEISVSKNLGGPVEIAQQFGGTWEWPHFWFLFGTLSMVLALMNLLPIPALDGGHVLFLLYEMVTRTKPSERFLENAQRVGTVLIMILMFYVLIVKRFI